MPLFGKLSWTAVKDRRWESRLLLHTDSHHPTLPASALSWHDTLLKEVCQPQQSLTLRSLTLEPKYCAFPYSFFYSITSSPGNLLKRSEIHLKTEPLHLRFCSTKKAIIIEGCLTLRHSVLHVIAWGATVQSGWSSTVCETMAQPDSGQQSRAVGCLSFHSW